MKNIIVGGYTIEQLKEIKDKVQPEAAALIDKHLQEAMEKFKDFKQSETKEYANMMAENIYNHLDIVNILAGISGIDYYIPYCSEYGECEENVITMFLDNWEEYIENEDITEEVFKWDCKDSPIKKLYYLASDMENNSKMWNSSWC